MKKRLCCHIKAVVFGKQHGMVNWAEVHDTLVRVRLQEQPGAAHTSIARAVASRPSAARANNARANIAV